MTSRRVLDWLLRADQPPARYLTLTQVLGRREDDEAGRAARSEITRTGWAAQTLAERAPWGGWEEEQNLYRPKYRSTNWRMLLLADLGATRDVPEVRKLCELWMARSPLKGGGVGGNSAGTPHLCFTGNLVRSLIRMGYVEDPRLQPPLEWLVRSASPKGGWSCFGSGRNLDSWEGLSAFAVYPKDRWTPSMERCVEKGAEFFLERQLHRQGARYPPWYRLHFPVHYYYDLLIGLELLTALGYVDDPRLEHALDWLEKKRRPDGRWNLDALHPDVEGAMATWFKKHPKDRPVPLEVEAPGKPSRLVTLRALTVLRRVGRA